MLVTRWGRLKSLMRNLQLKGGKFADSENCFAVLWGFVIDWFLLLVCFFFFFKKPQTLHLCLGSADNVWICVWNTYFCQLFFLQPFCYIFQEECVSSQDSSPLLFLWQQKLGLLDGAKVFGFGFVFFFYIFFPFLLFFFLFSQLMHCWEESWKVKPSRARESQCSISMDYEYQDLEKREETS